jgi:hypothetical protein
VKKLVRVPCFVKIPSAVFIISTTLDGPAATPPSGGTHLQAFVWFNASNFASMLTDEGPVVIGAFEIPPALGAETLGLEDM